MRRTIGYTIALSPFWGFLAVAGFGFGQWAPTIATTGIAAFIGVIWFGLWIADAA
jgi:hypothetical protein